MTIAPRFMGELPARAGSGSVDAVRRPIRRAFLKNRVENPATSGSYDAPFLIAGVPGVTTPQCDFWGWVYQWVSGSVPYSNPVPGIIDASIAFLLPAFLVRNSWFLDGDQNRDLRPNTLNYRANSDWPPFLVPDLRSWSVEDPENLGSGMAGAGDNLVKQYPPATHQFLEVGLAVPFLNPVPGIPRSCFLRSWSYNLRPNIWAPLKMLLFRASSI